MERVRNPTNGSVHYADGVIEQPEPNGLYSSHNSNATWIRYVHRHDGIVSEVPISVEGKVTCYPFPIKVDYENNRVTPLEDATPSISIKKNK